METLAIMILGLAMYYAWIHSVVIIVKKLKKATTYEKSVLYAGLVAFVLYLMATM